VSLIVRLSTQWIAIVALMIAPLLGVSLWGLGLPDPLKSIGGWCALFMAIVLPTGCYELTTRRYEFGPSGVKYRRLFRWHELPIPARLWLELSPDRQITLLNADTNEKLVMLSREFTRDGKLLAEIASYYRQAGHAVRVTPKHADGVDRR
jgi:hypothetical protein